MNENDDIELLIESICRLHPDMRFACTHGSCYRFHELLKLVYPDAIPYMDKTRSHVVTRIGNSFYDISGRLGSATGKAASRYHEMDESELKVARKWFYSA